MAFLVFLVVFLMVLTSEDSELTQTQESCICSVRVPQNYWFSKSLWRLPAEAATLSPASL